MIAALHPLLDDRHVHLRVDRGLVDDLGEHRLVDVVRAAAGDERAARVEQLQRAQVDFLVAGARPSRPPPCSSRTPAGRARSCRTARRAARARAARRRRCRRARRRRRRSARRSRGRARRRPRRRRYAIVSPAAAAERQREAAVVAEAVEQPAARVDAPRPRGSRADRETGRSSGPCRRSTSYSIPSSVTRDRVRHLAGQHVDALLQAFEQPRARIVARQNAARLQQLVERRRRPPAAAGPCPATASARRGSRRTDRRSATAADRLRRAPGGRRSRRWRATRGTRSPPRCAARSSAAIVGRASSPCVSIRSAICDRSL